MSSLEYDMARALVDSHIAVLNSICNSDNKPDAESECPSSVLKLIRNCHSEESSLMEDLTQNEIDDLRNYAFSKLKEEDVNYINVLLNGPAVIKGPGTMAQSTSASRGDDSASMACVFVFCSWSCCDSTKSGYAVGNMGIQSCSDNFSWGQCP